MSHVRSTVIVADDDMPLRLMLAHFLSSQGYEVLQAADGRQAEKLLAASPEVRLVLIDLVMPNQEGIETIGRIHRRCPHLKIVAISGDFGRGFLPIAKRMGADTTLTKPFPLEALRGAVEQLIGSAGSFA